MDKSTLSRLIEEGKSVKQISKKLNIGYSTITRYLRLFGLITNQQKKRKIPNTLTKRFEEIGKDRISKIVAEKYFCTDILKELNVCYQRTTVSGLKKFCTENDISIKHFGTKSKSGKRLSLENVLKKNVNYSSATLRKRLIKAKLLKEVCYKCKLQPVWNGERLVLHLDHINGICDDNRLENLRILCPNCHSQTATYSGRNIKRNAKINRCSSCNKQITKQAQKCKSCVGKLQKTKIDWPDIDELQKMINKSSYVAVAASLGVSNTAVKKRLKNHGPVV